MITAEQYAWALHEIYQAAEDPVLMSFRLLDRYSPHKVDIRWIITGAYKASKAAAAPRKRNHDRDGRLLSEVRPAILAGTSVNAACGTPERVHHYRRIMEKLEEIDQPLEDVEAALSRQLTPEQTEALLSKLTPEERARLVRLAKRKISYSSK
jgi:hypothetical protein